MAVTVVRARYVQMGQQSAFDTPVAATVRYPGVITFNEEVDYYEVPGPQQVRGMTAGQLVNTRNHTTFQYHSELTYEEMLTWLLAGLLGTVTASGVGADKTWTFTPPVAGDPVPKYYTFEFAPYDWTTKYLRAVPNCLISKITITIPINAPCMIDVEGFGGKPAIGGTPTASMANATGREVAKGNLAKIFIDTSGAGIGGTQKSATVISQKITIETGLRPDFTQDGRTGLDYGKYLATDVMMSNEMTFEHEATAAAEIAAWRAGTKRFIRSQVTGSTVSSLPKTINLDACYEYVQATKIGENNGNDIITLIGRSAYDPTWAKIMVATVINALATAP